jgi:hypothetical protein
MRTRSWVGVGTAVVVVAVLAGGAVWAHGYQPLVAGSYAQQPDGSTVTGATTLVLRWEPGSTQQVTVSVRNEGRRPVTVTGLGYVSATGSPLQLDAAQWSSAERSPQLGRLRDFPASVAAGKEIAVRLSLRQLACGWQPGSGAGNDLLQVRTKELGLEHDWRAPVKWEAYTVSAPASVPAQFARPC